MYTDETEGTMNVLSELILGGEEIETVRLLLEYGADANSVRTYHNYEYSALYDAVMNVKKTKFVKLLFEYGADLNLTSENLLISAIVDLKSVEMVKVLLEHGANPNSISMRKRLAGYFRAPNEQHGISACQDKEVEVECCALSDAICEVGNVEMVKLLLEYGANPNYMEDVIYAGGYPGKISMLSQDVLQFDKEKSAQITKLLLEHGGNPNNWIPYEYEVNNKIHTNSYNVLQSAIVVKKDIDMIKLLLDHGANANYTYERVEGGLDKTTELEVHGSALYDARYYAKDNDIVKLLVKYGASWEQKVTNGKNKAVKVKDFPFG